MRRWLGVLAVSAVSACGTPALADWYVDLTYAQPWWPGVTLRLTDQRGPHPSHESCTARLRQIMDAMADGVRFVPFDTGLRVVRARCFEARRRTR
jgi:hypothetical protein